MIQYYYLDDGDPRILRVEDRDAYIYVHTFKGYRWITLNYHPTTSQLGCYEKVTLEDAEKRMFLEML